MHIGYARVSTEEQDTRLQFDALAAAGCERIYQEAASGSNRERPELAKCLDALRSADTLTVWRLDRLGRSLKDLVGMVSDLEARGVALSSLNEAIDTGSAGGIDFSRLRGSGGIRAVTDPGAHPRRIGGSPGARS